MITVNFKDVLKKHGILLSKTGIAVQKQADLAGKAAVDFVQTKPTFTPRSGNLQKRTDYRVAVRSGGKVLFIRNRAKYGAAIDSGSGLYGPSHAKYMIAARRTKSLRFVWKGQLVFRRYVMHPGVKPRRFLRSAANIAGPHWFHGIESEFESIAKAF